MKSHFIKIIDKCGDTFILDTNQVYLVSSLAHEPSTSTVYLKCSKKSFTISLPAEDIYYQISAAKFEDSMDAIRS